MLLEAHPSSEVYFLYTDHHGFRDRVYKLTTGRVRTVREDMFGLLKDWDVGEQVITGLRRCGLKRLDRGKLLRAFEARLDRDKLFRALEASGL